jgi:hypothetical protein
LMMLGRRSCCERSCLSCTCNVSSVMSISCPLLRVARVDMRVMHVFCLFLFLFPFLFLFL